MHKPTPLPPHHFCLSNTFMSLKKYLERYLSRVHSPPYATIASKSTRARTKDNYTSRFGSGWLFLKLNEKPNGIQASERYIMSIYYNKLLVASHEPRVCMGTLACKDKTFPLLLWHRTTSFIIVHGPCETTRADAGSKLEAIGSSDIRSSAK